jgi:hypothetical protein
MKILILGSMTFSPEMKSIGEELKSKGHEIKLPEFIEDYMGCTTREEMHQRAVENKLKYNIYEIYHTLIEQTDSILIVNKDKKGIKGYIGANALIEMGFAKAMNKKIFLLNSIPEMDYTDEITATEPIILNGNLELIK